MLRCIFVTGNPHDILPSSMLQVKDLCMEQGIEYDIRPYNANKYSHDKYNIETLPSVHIYVNKALTDTLHEDQQPYKRVISLLQNKENPSPFLRFLSFLKKKTRYRNLVCV
jgi:hypothetical protein